jgi:hypothetical protein
MEDKKDQTQASSVRVFKIQGRTVANGITHLGTNYADTDLVSALNKKQAELDKQFGKGKVSVEAVPDEHPPKWKTNA